MVFGITQVFRGFIKNSKLFVLNELRKFISESCKPLRLTQGSCDWKIRKIVCFFFKYAKKYNIKISTYFTQIRHNHEHITNFNCFNWVKYVSLASPSVPLHNFIPFFYEQSTIIFRKFDLNWEWNTITG